MPRKKWNGYERFCPLARGLDLIGERWVLVIIQELFHSPKRYSDLQDRIPGIGNSVLADRLRKLEEAGIIARNAGAVGEPILYELTKVGWELDPILRALRVWGTRNLINPITFDDTDEHDFDMTFIENIKAIDEEEYEWHVDDTVTTLRIIDGHLVQTMEQSDKPAIVLHTSWEFIQKWAAGELNWRDGLQAGFVTYEGTEAAWNRMLAATGYVPEYILDRKGNS